MKLRRISLVFPALLLGGLSLAGCSNDEEVRVLRILNAEDYIYEFNEEEDLDYAIELSDEEKASMSEEEIAEFELRYGNNYRMNMVKQFEEYWKKTHNEKIEVVYDTFDTNETMFNELNTGKTTYDVIVPSDYMIQKLRTKGLLEPFDNDFIEKVYENIPDFLKNKFANVIVDKSSGSDAYYSVPYMWGTVGVMYNPEYYAEYYGYEEDEVHKLFSDWDSLYGEELQGTFSIKDSVRDTYAVSLIHRYRDIISELGDDAESQKELAKIFNMYDEDTMAEVKKDMISLKENSFGFETDSGKTDMTTMKIGANMCWSGDATWAITEAEEFGREIYYSIPTSYNDQELKGASNIWFDGFCMPKSNDLHKDLAQGFIEFMSQPENAAQNCYCIGYTPAIAGDEMLEYILGEYSAEATFEYYKDCLDGLDEKYDELFAEAKNKKQIAKLEEEKEAERESLQESIEAEQEWINSNKYTTDNYYDLRYFYGNDVDDAYFLPCLGSVGRQLTAQYPSEEVIPRLAIMENFSDEGTIRLLDMWEQVRTNSLPLWGIIVLSIEAAAALGFGIYLIMRKTHRKKDKKARI